LRDDRRRRLGVGDADRSWNRRLHRRIGTGDLLARWQRATLPYAFEGCNEWNGLVLRAIQLSGELAHAGGHLDVVVLGQPGFDTNGAHHTLDGIDAELERDLAQNSVGQRAVDREYDRIFGAI
jgi:hypothetical protein